MFTKGEINLGYIFSTVVAVFVAGVLLHVFMSKREKTHAPVLQKVEEKQPTA